MKREAFVGWCIVSALLPSAVRAATTTLTAVGDTSIFEEPAANSGGGSPGIFSGTNGMNSSRRALLAFDVLQNATNSNGVPAGSVITGVELHMHLGNAPNSDPHDIGLHRLNRDWGEGTAGSTSTRISMTGQGFAAGEGDATWNSAKWSSNQPDDAPWTSAGAAGDFNATASSTATVTGPIDSPTPFVWGTSTAMVSDVQSWLDAPTSNFGWIMINNDEDVTRSIKVFYSSEATVNASDGTIDQTWRPSLMVTYSPHLIPPTGDYNGNGDVDAADYVVWRETLGQAVTTVGSGTDGNESGAVDHGDYDYWRARFSNSTSGLATGQPDGQNVPESAHAATFMVATVLAYSQRRR